MKTKETTIKILFLAIVCALISATMFSMKPPRAVSYAETESCQHEYDNDCDDECNRCGRGTRRIYRGDADKKETQKIRRAKVRFYF